jgi:hypothetical protein
MQNPLSFIEHVRLSILRIAEGLHLKVDTAAEPRCELETQPEKMEI